MTIHDQIANLVRAHLNVFYEIEALDAEMRRPLDAPSRRAKPPWIMAGRTELAVEELAVWRSLDLAKLTENEAVSAMRNLMGQYYS